MFLKVIVGQGAGQGRLENLKFLETQAELRSRSCPWCQMKHDNLRYLLSCD